MYRPHQELLISLQHARFKDVEMEIFSCLMGDTKLSHGFLMRCVLVRTFRLVSFQQKDAIRSRNKRYGQVKLLSKVATAPLFQGPAQEREGSPQAEWIY